MFKFKIVSEFNKLLEVATNPKQSESDRTAITKICDMIEENIIMPEDAIQTIHTKIMNDNPQIVILGLKVLEIVFLKCGSIVHKVICTPEYMELLKDIIISTEHTIVREKIFRLLENWANIFEYFPQYSQPQKLLESLKSDAKGLKINWDDNANLRFEQFKKNYGLQSKTPITVIDNVNNPISNNIKSEPANINSIEKNAEFNKEIDEYKMKKKLDYKKYLKSQGLPTSSDEENCTIAESEQASIPFNIDEYQYKDKKSIDNETLTKSHKLPKELENSRNQRLHLNWEARKVRALKHQNFLENSDHNCTELRQCQNRECEWSKKKAEPEDTVIPKYFPYVVRKIKESKKKLANDFEEYKKSRKEFYYAQKTDTGIKPTLGNTNEEKKSLTKGEAEEEEQLKHALLLSQIENGPPTDQNCNDDEMLQLAIDMSFAEADNNYVSPEPQSDEDFQLSFAKGLTLNESCKQKTASDRFDATIGICIKCHARNFLKRFEPCNHTCICDECADEYNSQSCPICKEYYTTISWNM